MNLLNSGAALKSVHQNLRITPGLVSEELVIYTADHEIVKITPLSAQEMNSILFIVQADINENGERVDQGLYMLREKEATKLLDHGRDAAAAEDDTAYFVADDGIYTYDATNIKAEKYGTVTDDLIGIAKVIGSDVIYVLTADNVVYKVTEEGTTKEVVKEVVNAKEIILDHGNNLYFYTNENVVYVLVGDEVRKIEGLPDNPSFITILNPSLDTDENRVPVIVDGNKFYFVYEDGTSEPCQYPFPDERLTACSVENSPFLYFGYNKEVFKYDPFIRKFSPPRPVPRAIRSRKF